MEIKDSKYGYANTFYTICTVLLWGFSIGILVQVALIVLEFIWGDSHPNIINQMYVEFVDMAVILILLTIARRILLSAKEGNPFVNDNIRQLRLLAAIYIGASVLLGTLPTILHLTGLLEIKETVNLIRNNSFLLNTGGFITGLIFLFLAEVFEVGVNLKKENELMI